MGKGDVIKIRRADLPDVIALSNNRLRVGPGPVWDGDMPVAFYQRKAGEFLAVAEYVKGREAREREAEGYRRLAWLRFLKDAAGYVYDNPERNKMFLQMAEALAAKGLEPPK